MKEELIYQIAMGMIPFVGPTNAKKLISHFGGVKSVFEQSELDLKAVPGIRDEAVKSIINKSSFFRSEQEMKFVEQNKLSTFFYTESEYPRKLKFCQDAPLLLYGRGNMRLNTSKIIGVVGTRRATKQGIVETEKLIKEVLPFQPLIVSGLAFGIDICAHKKSVDLRLQTVACLGHSLDRIYPSVHGGTANRMQENGGLLTEFMSGTKPDAQNFPSRNRVIAGMCDVLVVVESGNKGGSLITAEIAHSYDRDVMAIPGRNSDPYSVGCNRLIKQQKAVMYNSIDDLERLMQWTMAEESRQQEIFVQLTEEENTLATYLQESGRTAIDEIAHHLNEPVSKISSLLLSMEFKGVIRSWPGKMYSI